LEWGVRSGPSPGKGDTGALCQGTARPGISDRVIGVLCLAAFGWLWWLWLEWLKCKYYISKRLWSMRTDGVSDVSGLSYLFTVAVYTLLVSGYLPCGYALLTPAP